MLSGRTVPLRDPRAALKSGLALVTEDRRRFGLLLEESVGFNLSLSSLTELARAGVIRGRDHRIAAGHRGHPLSNGAGQPARLARKEMP